MAQVVSTAGPEDGVTARSGLSKTCAALVSRGEPEGFDDFMDTLTTGRLAATLRAVQDAMHLPVRPPPPSGSPLYTGNFYVHTHCLQKVHRNGRMQQAWCAMS